MLVLIKNNKERILCISVFFLILSVAQLGLLENLAIIIMAILAIIAFGKDIIRTAINITLGEQYGIERDINKIYKECKWGIKEGVKRIEGYYSKKIGLSLLVSRLYRLKHDTEIRKSAIIGVISGIILYALTETGALELLLSIYKYLNNHSLVTTFNVLGIYLTLGIIIAPLMIILFNVGIIHFLGSVNYNASKKYLEEYEISIIENKIQQGLKRD